jgi:hypothetical protein
MSTLTALDLRVLDAITQVLASRFSCGSAYVYRHITASGALVTPNEFRHALERLNTCGAIQLTDMAPASRALLGDYVICGVDAAVIQGVRAKG